eukprot:scaffold184903_cov30-Tisochrysis_lutea.AAC.2
MVHSVEARAQRSSTHSLPSNNMNSDQTPASPASSPGRPRMGAPDETMRWKGSGSPPAAAALC